MTTYRLKYKRLDNKKELEAFITAYNMNLAVKRLVNEAEKKSVRITNISVSIKTEKNGGVQKYCDQCLVKMAGHGFKDKWYCKECKNDKKNDGR